MAKSSYNLDYFRSLITAEITFTAGRIKYEGIIHHVSNDSMNVRISNTKNLDKNIEVRGFTSFYASEFEDVEIIKPVKEKDLEEERKKTIEEVNAKIGFIPKDYRVLEKPQDEDDKDKFNIFDSMYTEDKYELQENSKKIIVQDQQFCSIPKYVSHLTIPTMSHLISEVDNNFHMAIEEIKTRQIIGLSLRGKNISRDGVISWLTISTLNRVYLFDIKNMHRDAFSNGLKDILESKVLVKIIHNCTMISDALLHIYKVELDNVYDTSIVMELNYRENNPFWRYRENNPVENPPLSSLAFALKKILRLSYTAFNERDIPEGQFFIRPLIAKARTFLFKDVIYLHELYNALKRENLKHLFDPMETYMHSIAFGTQTYEEALQFNPISLFPAFEKLEI